MKTKYETNSSAQVNDFFEKLPDKRTLERRIFPLRSDIARFWYYKEEIQKVSCHHLE